MSLKTTVWKYYGKKFNLASSGGPLAKSYQKWITFFINKSFPASHKDLLHQVPGVVGKQFPSWSSWVFLQSTLPLPYLSPVLKVPTKDGMIAYQATWMWVSESQRLPLCINLKKLVIALGTFPGKRHLFHHWKHYNSLMHFHPGNMPISSCPIHQKRDTLVSRCLDLTVSGMYHQCVW